MLNNKNNFSKKCIKDLFQNEIGNLVCEVDASKLASFALPYSIVGTIVEDGFDTQGVEQLVKLTGTLLQQSVHDANRALHMFKGATPQNHADEFSALLDKLLAEVTKLRQVSAAARRRL